MSNTTPKLLLGFLVVALAFGSTTIQLAIAQTEAEAVAAAEEGAHARAQSAARWEAAVESAREAAAPVADAARSAQEAVGDLAGPADTAELADAVVALDEATARRDIGAIAARRDDVVAAIGAFRAAVAANAHSLLSANPSADQTLKDELTTAIADLRAGTADAHGSVSALAGLRSIADRVVESHEANAAAAAAAAARAADDAVAMGSTRSTGSMGSTGSTGSTGSAQSPGIFDPAASRPPIPPLTIEARGDFRPGCTVILEWDWWNPDATGYVVVDPGYPYDIQIMEIDGWQSSVKSLPCAEE